MAYRELVENFELTQDEKGITATRVYLYSATDNTYNETLPEIGEVFNPDYINSLPLINGLAVTELYCRNRAMKFIASDVNTWQIVCTYTNEPVDVSGYSEGSPPNGSESIPTNTEYTGEYQVYEPPEDADSNIWSWKSDSQKVDTPIYFRVRTSNIRKSRILTHSNFELWKGTANSTIGKVNDAIFEGMGIGCVIFTGYTTERYNNYKDELTWRVELTFSYRDPDGTDENGWLKILRKTGSWDIPQKAQNTYMYDTADFTKLFD